MQELEKLMLERLASLQILSDKLNDQRNLNKSAQDKIGDAKRKMEELQQAATETQKAIDDVASSVSNAAMDPSSVEVESSEDVVVSMNEEAVEGVSPEILDVKMRDEEQDLMAKQSALQELGKMLKIAHSKDDWSSVYKIERAIQEIMDTEDED